MYQENEDEQLKFLQKFIPDATPEKLKVFQNCMRTEAVYKSALPYGIFTTGVTHMVLPKKLGTARPLLSIIAGLITYMYGKLSYMPVCSHKAFGVTYPLPKSENRRTTFPAVSDHVDTLDEQDQRGRDLSLSDTLIEHDTPWDNFDADYDSNANVSDDTSNYLQEEGSNKQPVNDRRRVTYDELWLQHREQQIKEKYRDLLGNAPNNPPSRSRPVMQRRDTVSEGPPIPEADVERRDIWS